MRPSVVGWTPVHELLPDPDDAAERLHVDRIADEFFEGFDAVADIAHPAVSIFGSARVGPDHPDYEAAREIGRRFAAAGFAVVTGGGPGSWRPPTAARRRRAACLSASTSSSRTSSGRTRTSTSASPSDTSTSARRCS